MRSFMVFEMRAAGTITRGLPEWYRIRTVRFKGEEEATILTMSGLV